MLHSLRHIAAVLILVLWVPATLHCAFEEAKVLGGILECQSHDRNGQNGDSGCSYDACTVVEELGFRHELITVVLPLPSITEIFQFQSESMVSLPQPGWVVAPVRTENWSVFWRFIERVTPPVRAPVSLV